YSTGQWPIHSIAAVPSRSRPNIHWHRTIAGPFLAEQGYHEKAGSHDERFFSSWLPDAKDAGRRYVLGRHPI
ncbi:MAG: hypothetical protein ACRD4S_06530, partial [Candidatus Acidiferrales bacterium]